LQEIGGLVEKNRKTTEMLKRYFGYDSFRSGQEEVINSILNERDALAIMPTGAGKSLCFQIPALIFEGVTLVISPLISLMQDQVQALKQAGIAAAYINSSLSQGQTHTVIARAMNGAYKIIYVAPERLDAPSFVNFVYYANISMIAVDEAHCVSQWGQDFRPSYLNIFNFVASLPARPILTAFTATATDTVKTDIVKLLGLQNPFLCSTGFNRENLYFEVRHSSDKFSELSKYVQSDKSGIIYCATRKTVDELSEKLRKNGVSAERYHAGMTSKERQEAQNNFIYDKSSVIVATNAFGMGIDKSNVSFVVHYNMPKNMESYYQEAGRAGRDGSPADCVLFYSNQDIVINRFLIDNGEGDDQKKAHDYKLLQQMEQYCKTTDCLRKFILDYFRDIDKCECNNCSNCLTEREMVDFTEEAQKILSCAKRLKGRFGVAMLIAVLRGANNQKIKEYGLESLSTYGILQKSEGELRNAVDYLVQKGYLQVVGDRYPMIAVTNSAAEILFSEKKIEIPLYQHQKGNDRTARAAKSLAKYAVDNNLFESLKKLRLQIATQEQVPAFVVFSDATLYDMCGKLPANETEFLNVSGVGATKLQRYGTQFLELIQKFTQSGVETKPREEVTDIDELFNKFAFSQEPVTLSGFLQQANLLLMQIRGKGTASNVLAKLLEDDGFLFMCELDSGNRRRKPTERGLNLGISSRTVKNPDGRIYMQNFYDAKAQEVLLGYVREMAVDLK